MVTTIIFVSAAANATFGSAGLVLAAATAGAADSHSPAISVASIVAAGNLSAGEAVLPILAAFTTNAVSKVGLARWKGGRGFGLQIAAAQACIVGAAWAAWAVPLVIGR